VNKPDTLLSRSRDSGRHVHYQVESDGDDRVVRVAQRAAADGSPATRWAGLTVGCLPRGAGYLVKLQSSGFIRPNVLAA